MSSSSLHDLRSVVICKASQIQRPFYRRRLAVNMHQLKFSSSRFHLHSNLLIVGSWQLLVKIVSFPRLTASCICASENTTVNEKRYHACSLYGNCKHVQFENVVTFSVHFSNGWFSLLSQAGEHKNKLVRRTAT